MAREILTMLRHFYQKIKFSMATLRARRPIHSTGNPVSGEIGTMSQAKFSLGQIVYHRFFDYREVIFDIDFEYQGSEEWYNSVSRSRSPKVQPWYHVLADNADHETYVAERNLESSGSMEPMRHPGIDFYFSGLENGVYVPLIWKN